MSKCCNNSNSVVTKVTVIMFSISSNSCNNRDSSNSSNSGKALECTLKVFYSICGNISQSFDHKISIFHGDNTVH